MELNPVKQMILDFESKAEAATTELCNTQNALDRVRLVAEASIYRQCAEKLTDWNKDICKYHGMDIWDHISTYDIVQELKKRYPTELKLSLGVLEIIEQIR